jgi:predicted nucleotide-binding protein
VLRHLVAPAAPAAGYNWIRFDPLAGTTSISAELLEHILNADVVVADVSGRDPNVLYSLGVRHASGHPVIILSARGERVTFDGAVRIIYYDLTDLDAMDAARADLIAALKNVGDRGPVNPVAQAIDLTSLREASQRELASGDEHTIMSILTSIDMRLSVLEERYSLDTEPNNQATKPQYGRRVFIVHGHDGELKTELARLLEKLEFRPVILHEEPDRGQTIVSKLRTEMADVGFAFGLLTPDDTGSMAGAADASPRARQNVIFEHGLFTAHLGPDRVCAIRRGDVEIPSDLHGILYKTVPVGGSLRSIAFEIISELRAAGYLVDANLLLPS